MGAALATTPVGLAAIVTPSIAIGVFVPGLLLFWYLQRRSPSRLNQTTLLLLGIGAVYVIAELLVVIVGGLQRSYAASLQLYRVEQLVLVLLPVGIALYIQALLRVSARVYLLHRIVTIALAGVAAVITVAAFAYPSLFVSLEAASPAAILHEAVLGRGAPGVLYHVRNAAIMLVALYSVVLMIVEALLLRKSRYTLVLLAGFTIAAGFAIADIAHDVIIPLSVAPVPFGVVAFALFSASSMVAASWRFVDQARDVEAAHSDLVRHQSRLSYLASHDQLTGTRNRKAFYELLVARSAVAAQRTESALGLLYIDLDYFKEINDSYGHRAGDQVLAQISNRLAAELRQTDDLFRIGGDEFALMINCAPDGHDLTIVAQKLLSIFQRPVVVDQREFYLAASCGAAVLPTHAQSTEELVTCADLALYEAKRERNAFRLFQPEMRSAGAGRIEILQQLRHDSEIGAFDLAYQPIVDTSGDPVGYEALFRWPRQNAFGLNTQQTIDLAESAGLIDEIDKWMLNRMLVDFESLLGEGGPYVSINVSAKGVARPEFASSALWTLAEHKVDASSVRFEITETSLVRDLAGTGSRLIAAADLGLRFVIDDFGKGYSSLSYLNYLPVSTVKLDREFIQDVPSSAESRALLLGIIAMTRALGLTVVAEGVETKDQLDFLLEAGVERFQGYYFGRPGPFAKTVARVFRT